MEPNIILFGDLHGTNPINPSQREAVNEALSLLTEPVHIFIEDHHPNELIFDQDPNKSFLKGLGSEIAQNTTEDNLFHINNIENRFFLRLAIPFFNWKNIPPLAGYPFRMKDSENWINSYEVTFHDLSKEIEKLCIEITENPLAQEPPLQPVITEMLAKVDTAFLQLQELFTENDKLLQTALLLFLQDLENLALKRNSKPTLNNALNLIRQDGCRDPRPDPGGDGSRRDYRGGQSRQPARTRWALCRVV